MKDFAMDCLHIAYAIWVPIIAVFVMWFVAIPLVMIALGVQWLADRMVMGAEWISNKLESAMQDV